MLFGGSGQSYHLLDHFSNMIDLGTDIRCHIVGRIGAVLQHDIVILQLVQTVYNDAGTVRIFGSKLTYDSNTVHDRITCLFDLFDSCDHTLQICLNTVSHSTVRFIQMLDGHDIADVAEDNTGEFQLIILRIGGGIITDHDAVSSTAYDDQRICNTTGNHEFFVFIQNQKAGYREYVGKRDWRFRRTDNVGIKYAVANDQIIFVKFRCKTFDPQQDLSDKDRKPAEQQKYKIVRGSPQPVCNVAAIVGGKQNSKDQPDLTCPPVSFFLKNRFIIIHRYLHVVW